MKKKILITGSGGFIGRNLVEKLGNEYLIENPRSNELDLMNEEKVQTYLEKNQFNLVIHSANCNNTRNKETTPYDSLDGNLRMFFNLARCRNLYDKMYYFGSGAEYDMNHYIPLMKEEYLGTYIPKDSYGFSKYIMSEYSMKSENIYDLTLFGVYGIYEEWERRFISNAICRTLLDLPITIRRNVFFDYIWIDDLVDLMGWFIENTPCYKHYNVCTGNKIDLYTLACIIREVTNVSSEIIVGEEGLNLEYTGDNGRLMQEINGYKFTDYYESIGKLTDFYKRNIDKIDKDKL